MMTFIDSSDNRHDDHDIANYIVCSMVMVHPMAFYLLVVLRIHYSFRKTGFAFNHFERAVIGICVLIVVGATSMEQISWILVIHGNTPFIPVERLTLCLWIWMGSDVVSRLFLVYMFIHKLFRVLVMTNNGSLRHIEVVVDAKHENEENKNQSMELSMNQIEFLSVIRKVSLLGVLSLLPLTVSRIAYILDFWAKDGELTHRDWIAFNSVQTVAVFVEILALFLIFKHNQSTYYFLCGRCDSGCSRCCDAEAKRKLAPTTKARSDTATGSAPNDISPRVQSESAKPTTSEMTSC